MSDAQRVPDGSADAGERAGATEDYGGVPISEQELAEVWTTDDGNGGSDAAPQSGSASAPDAADAGQSRPEVPQDDPAPTEPS